ncbi:MULTISPECIES: type II toxin-antitoxin system RelE/ParE family toxin [Moraxella]|uniref:Addiction module toxin RelE n=1 Tax=Moraxella lacunata TaxID=477 RepID=A0A1B8PV60_MORLA|nr:MULTISPECIES: type II toxin-antitoxin system RelE/ParE family toxin [Moraxella]MBE9579971.1 type II toxin-antitoxin system RelE/ParE family toxin [Moraxella sp. K1664]MBE9589362.1 type II toxin-antitoxin system RelE/ParE family toxin [Moraxella sp. K1630]MBE9597640.1 type II toxin-antitoxin system RelE/ParE family toxin [Moraxella sp. K2450]MDH9220136.1 type II toxin-antitoxin system RelE/ParE family toxin [Moraxella lacunata]MDI4484125.1 diaminopimelate decarboxylase [Moraxella lacunata]
MYIVETTDEFECWFDEQPLQVQMRLLEAFKLLEQYGHRLARPYADTLYGSKFSNMKELRIQIGGDPYRAFYAFDPLRQAIVLCAGNKVGNEKQFYKQMIPLADELYQQHLDKLTKQESPNGNA